MMEVLEESNKIKLEIKEEIKEEEDNIDQDYKRICDSLVVSVKDEIKPTFINASYQPFCSDNSRVDCKHYDIKKCKDLMKPLCFNLVKNEDIKTKDSKENSFLYCLKEGIFQTIKEDPFCESSEDKRIDVTSKDTSQDYNIEQDNKRICDSLVVSVEDETKPTFINASYQPFCSDNSRVDCKNDDIKKCKVLIKPVCLNLVKNEDIASKDYKEDTFLWCIKEGIFKTIKKDSFCESSEDKKIYVTSKDTSQEKYNIDRDYKRICDSLVVSVKDETKPTDIDVSYQPFSFDNSEVDYKNYDIKKCKVLIKPLCLNLVKNEDIATKDYKEDTLLWCIKEGIFKTIKKDSFCESSEAKRIDFTSKDISQRNSCEMEEEFSDANMDEPPSMKNVCQESTITKLSTERKKKKYIRLAKHICQYCDKKFVQSDIFKHHLMIHTGERPYECNFCCKRFRIKRFLNLHIQTHTVKKYPCTVCSQRFTSNYNLLEHMLIHENKRKFKCTLCSSRFNKRNLLYKHIVCVHNKEKEYVETLTATKSSAMNSEKNNISKPLAEFQCEHCKKIFTTKENVRYHIKHMHILNNAIRSKTSLSKSCSKPGEINGVSFTCAVCKANFKIRKLFIQHIQNIHPTEKPYGCTSCNKSFKNNSNLKIHIIVHHTNKINSYVCDICSMSFYRETYLKRHYKIHTQSDRKLICDVCTCKCRSKTDMKRHLATHFGGGDKPHQCEFCGKSFSRPSKLVRHKVVHTGERAYKCQFCDKTYKDEGSLKYHENSHEGKTFTCVNCGFKSINKHSFKHHIRKMMCDKKIFKCDVCEQKLTSEKYFKNHMEKFHSEHE